MDVSAVPALVALVEHDLSACFKDWDVDIGKTTVSWQEEAGAIDVRLDTVRLSDPSGRLRALIPVANLTLHPESLAMGTAMPIRGVVENPTVRVPSGPDLVNAVDALTVCPSRPGDVARPRSLVEVLAILVASRDPAHPLHHFSALDIQDARVLFEGADPSSRAGAITWDAGLMRTETGFVADLAADLNAAASGSVVLWPQTELAASAVYAVGVGGHAAIAFADLRPSVVAELLGAGWGLEALQLPLTGTVTIGLGAGGEPETAGLQLAGGPGRVDAAAVATNVGVLADEPATPTPYRIQLPFVDVETLALGGHFDALSSQLRIGETHVIFRNPAALDVDDIGSLAGLTSIDGYGHADFASEPRFAWNDLRLAFAEGGVIRMRTPVAHDFPVRSILSSGTWDGTAGTLGVTAFMGDLAGPTLLATVSLDPAERGAENLAATVSLYDLPTDDIANYWPPDLAPGGYDWVTANLSGGGVSVATVDVAGTFDADGDFWLQNLGGRFDAVGVDVQYLPATATKPALPPIRAVTGNGVFDEHSLTITVTDGDADFVDLVGGHLVFTGLDEDWQYLTVAVETKGPVSRHMAFLDQDRLGYARAVNIAPSDTAGQAHVWLSVHLPLLADLELEHVDIAAKARLTNAGLRGKVLGHDIRDGTLELDVTKAGMAYSGTATLSSTAGQAVFGRIDGRKSFLRGEVGSGQIRVSIPRGSIMDIQQLLFNEIKAPAHFVRGDIAAAIEAKSRGSDWPRVVATLDLGLSHLDVPHIGWAKPSGVPGRAWIVADLVRGELRSIPQVTVRAPNLDITAALAFDERGAFASGDVSSLKVGRTRGRLALDRDATGGWRVDFTGPGLDLAPVMEMPDGMAGEDASTGGDGDPMATVSASVDVDAVWLRKAQRPDLRNLKGTMKRVRSRLTELDITGSVRRPEGEGMFGDREPGDPFSLQVWSEGPRRYLHATATQSGALLSSFGISEPEVTGGWARLTGEFLDRDADLPIAGRLVVDDFRVRKAPVVAQVLSALAFGEMKSTLRGGGLTFDTMVVPFTVDRHALVVTDAYVKGATLGATLKGQVVVNESVDVADWELNLRGTVVPFNTINTALGRLPLIGALFSGGEHEGGMFSPTFALAGSAGSPDVLVNPVAGLLPGITRNIFDFFGSPEPAQPDAERQEPESSDVSKAEDWP